MGNGKSKEGGKSGLLAVSRNSIDEPPPTKSNTSIRPNNRVNIYVDDSANNNNNQSNPPTTNTNNNTSLHQSQLSNDSSSTNNNTTTTTTPPNNNNNNQTATTISNTNTDSTTSSSPNATNNSVLSSQQQQLASFGAQSGSSIVFGVDVSVAVQRSCKLILKLLLQKKQQESGTTTTPLVEECISEEKKNEYKHPLASDEEIEAIEKVCANLETLFIPDVIRQSLRYLNSYSALLEQGVYRIPGDTQKMKEYKEAFDKGQSIDFLAENREIDRKRKEAQDNGITVDIVHHGIKHDAHDVAGLIKLFLRELPGDSHLFTSQTAPEFAISHLKNFTTEEEKVESVRTSLYRVPRSNRDTLRALCEHFRLIIKYEKSNKMTTDNLLKCICGTSPYVLAFYFMVQHFDIVFREEKKESKPLTEEEMNSTKNIEWLLRAQNEGNNVLSLGNLSHLTGGNNNLSNEVLAGKAMSARESRRKSYYQRQQRNDSTASEETTTSDGFASPSTIDNSNSDNLDPITMALLKMKKDKDTQNESSITTNNVDTTQENNDASIMVEM